MTSSSKHIAIVGAGLVGRLLAWRLLKAGHAVNLYDQHERSSENYAGRVAAAMLAPYSEMASSDKQVFEWGMQGLSVWSQWARELTEDSGLGVEMQQLGSVVVAHQADQNNLHHFNQILRSRLDDLSGVEFLRQQQLSQLEPELATTFDTATFLKAEGCIDNWAALDAMAAAIDTFGGLWHESVEVTEVGCGYIKLGDERQEFDWVVDCRGVGAKQDLSGLRGVRGEVLWVDAPEVSLSRPVRLMHPRYQLYIAPKPNRRYVIGATEIESESMAPITVRSSLELQSALYSVHKGFSEANIIRAFAHCRPAFMDNLPKVLVSDQLLQVNGLYRHGYLLAPTVIQSALNALEGHYSDSIIEQSVHSRAVV